MDATVAKEFFNDPQVNKSIQTLVGALQKKQKEINGIKPPKTEQKVAYNDLIKKFGELRGGALFFPFLGSGIGNGPLVELGDGSVKYDFIIGIGVHYFGHSHPGITEACLRAALNDTVMQGNLQQNVECVAYVEKMLQAAGRNGAKLDHCFLSNTGVMAGENAMKIAMQKKRPAHRVLAFSNCFAGRTMAFSQITDKPKFRDGLPQNLIVDYVPFYNPEKGAESIQQSVDLLKQHLARYPGQYAAMVFELVQGEGGFNVAPPEFHRKLMELLHENNVAVLVDEVQTWGRTPELFAFQWLGLDDLVDIVWFGKASQVCGVLFPNDYKPAPGLLSQTFTTSSSAIAAGQVILDELLEGSYFGTNGKITRLHQYFSGKLRALSEAHPDWLRGPFGVGAMTAFTPFRGEADKAMRFVKEIYEQGVLTFVAGANPSRVRFLLPVPVIEEKDIDAIMEIIKKTFSKTE